VGGYVRFSRERIQVGGGEVSRRLLHQPALGKKEYGRFARGGILPDYLVTVSRVLMALPACIGFLLRSIKWKRV